MQIDVVFQNIKIVAFVKNDKMVSNVYSQNKVECPA